MWILPFIVSMVADPGIGIPEPEFGLTQTAGPATYVIDNTHPSATDANNPNGSAAKPRKTIPRYLKAGDVVELRGGPYAPSGDRFWIEGTGTAAQPIFVRGADPNNRVALTRRIHPLGEYIIFENLKLVCADIRPVNGKPVSHVCFRHNELAGTGTFKSGESFMVSSADPNTPVHDIVLWDNHVHDNGRYDAPTEDDTSAFSVQTNAYNVWIVGNTAHHSGGDGVIIGHNAKFGTHHIYVGRNVFHHHRENGVDIKQATDVFVAGNELYAFSPVSSSQGEAVVVHYDSRRVWIIDNDIHHATFGVRSTGSKELYVIGNRFNDIVLDERDDATRAGDSPYRSGTAIQQYNSALLYAAGNTMERCVNGITALVLKNTTVVLQGNRIGPLIDVPDKPGYHVNVVGDASGMARSANRATTCVGAPRIRF